MLGEALRAAGRIDEAKSAAGRAVALYERKGNVVAAAAATRRLLDEVGA